VRALRRVSYRISVPGAQIDLPSNIASQALLAYQIAGDQAGAVLGTALATKPRRQTRPMCARSECPDFSARFFGFGNGPMVKFRDAGIPLASLGPIPASVGALSFLP
jgi:hypothetical protein